MHLHVRFGKLSSSSVLCPSKIVNDLDRSRVVKTNKLLHKRQAEEEGRNKSKELLHHHGAHYYICKACKQLQGTWNSPDLHAVLPESCFVKFLFLYSIAINSAVQWAECKSGAEGQAMSFNH